MSGLPRFFVGVSAGVLLAATTTQARVWVVRPDGTGDAPTIQAAIDSLAEMDGIALADGVYTGPGNRDLTNSEHTVRIWSLSGDPTTCVIDCQGSAPDRHFGIAFYSDG